MSAFNNLEKVEIFKGLDEAQLNLFKNCCQIKTVNEGTKIFGDQDPAYSLWSVVEGEVDLRFDLPGRDSDQETTIAKIKEGKVLGWSSFVPPFRYRLSSYCSSKECQLIEINRDCLLKTFENNALIGYQVMSNLAIVIGTRFQQLQDEVALQEGERLMHQKDN
jgi:CRP-like cAMP-binding protein